MVNPADYGTANSRTLQAGLDACAKVPEAELLRHRAEQAIFVLTQAAQIRADEDLMAAVRTLIRERRDSLAVLLDEIG